MPFDYTKGRTPYRPSWGRQSEEFEKNKNSEAFKPSGSFSPSFGQSRVSGDDKMFPLIRKSGSSTYAKLKKANIGKSPLERRKLATALDNMDTVPSHTRNVARVERGDKSTPGVIVPKFAQGHTGDPMGGRGGLLRPVKPVSASQGVSPIGTPARTNNSARKISQPEPFYTEVMNGNTSTIVPMYGNLTPEQRQAAMKGLYEEQSRTPFDAEMKKQALVNRGKLDEQTLRNKGILAQQKEANKRPVSAGQGRDLYGYYSGDEFGGEAGTYNKITGTIHPGGTGAASAVASAAKQISDAYNINPEKGKALLGNIKDPEVRKQIIDYIETGVL